MLNPVRPPAVMLLCCLLAGLLLSACAQSLSSQGRRMAEQGQYDQAIDLFYRDIAARPQSPEPWRELGVTFYDRGDLDRAEDALKQANTIAPDARASLYLGMVNEKSGNVDQAIEAYKSSLGLHPGGETESLVRAHLDRLITQRVKTEVSAALQNEADLNAAEIPENTVAVADFDASLLKDDLKPIARGLAEFTAADLSKVKALNVVDRLKIDAILRELKMAESGLVQEGSGPRVGRLIGSRRLVTGSLLDIGENAVRLDGVIVNTTDSTTKATEAAEGNVQQFFQLQKAFVFKVLEDMDVEITAEERDAISKVPTENYLAFMAYCKGLQYERDGLLFQAQQSFSLAVQEDPGFAQAGTRAQTTSASLSMGAPGQPSLEAFETAVGETFEVADAPVGLDSRLTGSALQAGGLGRQQFHQGVLIPPVVDAYGRIVIRGNLDAQ